jgi:integrase
MLALGRKVSEKSAGVPMASIIKGKNARKPYTVRYRHEGRQRERSFATRKEADDFRVKFEHDSREQIFADPRTGNIRFREAAESWLSRYAGSVGSAAAYRSVLANHVYPALGDRTLRAVAGDREGVQAFLAALRAKKLSASTVSRCYTVVRAIVRGAVDDGKLPASAVRISGIKLPAVARRPDFIFPSHAQIEALAAGLPEPYGFTVWLMRGCGLRISEALAVRSDQLTNGVLRISEQLGRDLSYGPLKHRKPGEHRDIPLPAYVSQRAPQRDGRLFPPTQLAVYESRFRKARQAAGIEDGFTPHSLRHVFASVALSNGIPITDVSAWLGHRNIQTTFGIYGHLVPSAFDRAREVLDAEYSAWQ